jgi:hypothetical protein
MSFAPECRCTPNVLLAHATECLALLLIGALALWSCEVLALDSHELLKKCRDNTAASQAFCLGYIAGISDMLRSQSGSDPSLICIAAGAGPDQLRRLVLKFLREHPDGHASADGQISQALIDNFPCKDEHGAK